MIPLICGLGGKTVTEFPRMPSRAVRPDWCPIRPVDNRHQ